MNVISKKITNWQVDALKVFLGSKAKCQVTALERRSASPPKDPTQLPSSPQTQPRRIMKSMKKEAHSLHVRIEITVLGLRAYMLWIQLPRI